MTVGNLRKKLLIFPKIKYLKIKLEISQMRSLNFVDLLRLYKHWVLRIVKSLIYLKIKVSFKRNGRRGDTRCLLN
jgi:hypothetical protein